MVTAATAVATAVVEVTRGERIRITLPVATFGLIGLVGFCTAWVGRVFCTGLCTVEWILNGDTAVGDTTVGTDDLAAAAGGVLGGRAATVVIGGDVTGIVAGDVVITGVVTAGGVVLMGAFGVAALTGGKVLLAAAGGMSYFCI